MIRKICILILFISFLACDNSFKELNVNPTKPTQVDIETKLTASQLFFSGERYENWRANILYCEHMIQHFSTIKTYASGDKYDWNKGYASSVIDRLYGNAIKNLVDMLVQVEKEELPDEMKSIVRIQKVLVFQRVTDLYGDVPYFGASKGLIDNNLKPEYDKQEDIYNDMLKELEESVNDLPATGTSKFEDADLYYKGNFAKWKKLGNSIMLRLALRMIKVDPSKSQEWAEKAIKGGVMESNDDIAKINHTDGPEGENKNNIGEVFKAEADFRMSEALINFMRDKNDPRINVIASLPDKKPGADEDADLVDRPNAERLVAADQRGLPNGTNAEVLEEKTFPLNKLVSYSEPNRLLMIGNDKPSLHFVYAHVAFNLAEAGKRWSIGGDPKTNYDAGVTAAMKMLELFGSGGVISDADINAYLTANPYNGTEALKQINEQYWIASFLDGYEAYANWRRTNFPALAPVVDKTTAINTIPRRLTYPVSEQSNNIENYQKVVERQGEDILTTRMWWDKE